jgi:regulatory protein
LRKPKHRLAAQELFDFAVRSLARRAQSSAELRQKLRERAAEEASIEEVLGRLTEYGYLNDKRFAENYAASRLENERFGRARTLNDLRTRRVTGPVADAAVENTYKETDETALVEAYIRKKFRATPRETLFKQDKDLAGAYRRLLRAGFRSAVIVPVLKRFAKNPDLLDAIEVDPDAEAD